MSAPREGLPAEVLRLLDLEGAAAPVPDSARRRLAARLGLAAPVALPEPPVAVNKPWWASATLPAGVLLLASAATVAWVAARGSALPLVPPAPPAIVAPVEPAVVPVMPVPEIVPVPTPRSARSTPPARSEIAVLRRAHEALARDQASQALLILEQHRRRWPKGALVQEREVLAIQALTRIGDTAVARARAERFLSDFPESILVPRVRELVPATAPR
jgi:hypothetical protein